MSAAATAMGATTTVETAAAHAAAMEAAAGAHASAAVTTTSVAAVVAASIAAAEALAGLGVHGIAAALSNLSRSTAAISIAVVTRSIVGRTSGVIAAEASVIGAAYRGGLIASKARASVAGEVGAVVVAGKVGGSMIVACKARGSMVAAGKRAAIAAVEAGAGEARATGTATEAVVRAIVDVEAASRADVVIATVIEEVAAMPESAEEAGSEEAEAVVNSAVKADGGTPEAGTPPEAGGTGRPEAGGPEGADEGSRYPGSVHPLVAVTCPGPVAWCPNEVGAGSDGLNKDRDGRGRDGYRDKDTCMRGCGSHEENARDNRGADRIFEKPGELHRLPSCRSFVCPDFSRTSWSGQDRGSRPAAVCLPDRALIVIRHRLGGFVAFIVSSCGGWS
jgi:hypothetical protein